MSERERGRGRANAPGQNTVKTFVNDAGETVEGTMADFHATLREQGYRPVDLEETPDEEEEVEVEA
jgi:hypothetical protein